MHGKELSTVCFTHQHSPFFFLRLYNPTDEPVYLSRDYAFPSAGNGHTGTYEYWNEFQDGAVIPPHETFVICSDQGADPFMLALCNMTLPYLSNGDDGRCLAYGTETSHEIIDCFGDFEDDPGTGWPVCGVPLATVDNTLIRKPGFTADPTYYGKTSKESWDLSSGTSHQDCQWIIRPVDSFDNVGKPSYNWVCDQRPRLNCTYEISTFLFM